MSDYLIYYRVWIWEMYNLPFNFIFKRVRLKCSKTRIYFREISYPSLAYLSYKSIFRTCIVRTVEEWSLCGGDIQHRVHNYYRTSVIYIMLIISSFCVTCSMFMYLYTRYGSMFSKFLCDYKLVTIQRVIPK